MLQPVFIFQLLFFALPAEVHNSCFNSLKSYTTNDSFFPPNNNVHDSFSSCTTLTDFHFCMSGFDYSVCIPSVCKQTNFISQKELEKLLTFCQCSDTDCESCVEVRSYLNSLIDRLPENQIFLNTDFVCTIGTEEAYEANSYFMTICLLALIFVFLVLHLLSTFTKTSSESRLTRSDSISSLASMRSTMASARLPPDFSHIIGSSKGVYFQLEPQELVNVRSLTVKVECDDSPGTLEVWYRDGLLGTFPEPKSRWIHLTSAHVVCGVNEVIFLKPIKLSTQPYTFLLGDPLQNVSIVLRKKKKRRKSADRAISITDTKLARNDALFTAYSRDACTWPGGITFEKTSVLVNFDDTMTEFSMTHDLDDSRDDSNQWQQSLSTLTRSNHNPYATLNGLQSLAVISIIFGNCASIARDCGIWANSEISWPFKIISSSEFGIHAFFFASGFLSTAELVSEICESYSDWHYFSFYLCNVVRHYVRVVPLIAIAIAIYWLVMPWLIEDPYTWKGNELASECNAGWKDALLFISNLKGVPDCLATTWFLSAEMQCFLIAPLFALIYRRSGFLGLSATAFGITAMVLYLLAEKNLAKNLSSFILDGRSYSIFESQMYTQAYFRCISYLCGAFTVFFLHHGYRVRIRRALFLLSMAVLAFLINCNMSLGYTNAPCHAEDLATSNCGSGVSPFLRRLYAVLQGPAIASSLGIITLLSLHRTGIISSFLDHSLWTFPSKLSPIAILIHPTICYILFLNRPSTMTHIDVISFTLYFLKTIFLTFISSSIIHHIIYQPLLLLKEILFLNSGKQNFSFDSSPRIPTDFWPIGLDNLITKSSGGQQWHRAKYESVLDSLEEPGLDQSPTLPVLRAPETTLSPVLPSEALLVSSIWESPPESMDEEITSFKTFQIDRDLDSSEVRVPGYY